jgi:hypothetical protein
MLWVLEATRVYQMWIEPREKEESIMQSQTRTYGDTSVQTKGDERSTQKRIAMALFWAGLLVAVAFAAVAGWELTRNFRTLTSEELGATIWGLDGPLFMLWAFSVPLGSVLAGTGAFLYARTKPAFAWLTGIGVLGAVMVMTMIFSREYYAPLFGIGGVLILVFFFSIVWIWMRKVAALDSREKTASGLKLVGYLFWMNATWFLCGETGKLHLKAFAGDPAPSPIEIMVFLVLGWLFVLLGEYKSTQLKKS